VLKPKVKNICRSVATISEICRIISCDVDWQVLTEGLDHPVHRDRMVSVDGRELEEILGLEVETVGLVEKALQGEQVEHYFESFLRDLQSGIKSRPPDVFVITL